MRKTTPALRGRVLEDELRRAAAFRTGLRRFLARTDDVAAAARLTSQRYDLLLMIRSSGAEGVRITELCELLQMRQTAVTELVRRAEDARLIRRRPSGEDGRVWLLHLTKEGERRLLEAFAALQADREALAAAFDEVDLRFRASSRGGR